MFSNQPYFDRTSLISDLKIVVTLQDLGTNNLLNPHLPERVRYCWGITTLLDEGSLVRDRPFLSSLGDMYPSTSFFSTLGRKKVVWTFILIIESLSEHRSTLLMISVRSNIRVYKSIKFSDRKDGRITLLT